VRLIFGQLEPDNPAHLQQGLQVASNVYPGPNGYRPIKSFAAMTDALDEEFQGGVSFVGSDGTVNMLAGTATDLYLFDSTLAWTSILGSLTAGRWFFTPFGDVAIGCHGGTPVAIDLLAGTAAALTGSPPTATNCITIGSFVVLLQADGEQNMVRWSGFENQTQWVNGTNQAGEQPLLTGGEITGGAGGVDYGLIFQRGQVTRMTYTGADALIFQFDIISANTGCIAPGSVAQAGRLVFFLSDRGFQKTDGNDVQPIGVERIDRTFLDSYSTSDLANIYSVVDTKSHRVMWIMPGKAWIYDYALDKWSTLDTGVRAAFAGFTAGVSIDQLDAIYGDLDSMGDISLDDPRFRGGDPLLMFVNLSNEVGTLTGDNLEANFEPPFVELVQGREARLSQLRPLCDAVTGVQIDITSKPRLGNTGTTTVFDTMQASGDMDCRVAGRFLRPKVKILAGTNWNYFQGLDLTMMGMGGKR
jgi:hypothetical protein